MYGSLWRRENKVVPVMALTFKELTALEGAQIMVTVTVPRASDSSLWQWVDMFL